MRERQMTGLEMRSLPFGVRAERNTDADVMEEILGIRFPNKPSKARLDIFNRLALYRFSKENKGVVSPTTVRVSGLRQVISGDLTTSEGSKVGGWYDPEFNTFFYVKLKTDKRIGDLETFWIVYHENMHGFILGVNPDFIKVREEIAQAMSDELFRDKKMDEELRQRGTAYKVMNEGLSEWAAWETIVLQGERHLEFQDPKPSHSSHRKVVVSRIKLEGDTVDERLQDLLIKSERNLEDAKQFWFDQSLYEIGHYFVNEVLFLLRNSGMTRPEAIMFLVKNPPYRISHILNPTEFAKSLLLQ